MADSRQGIRVQQADGNWKIVFRAAHESMRMKEEVKQNTSVAKPKNTDNDGKNEKKHEKFTDSGRFYNPMFPGHVDLFGRDLIGKTLEFTLLNGEILSGVLLGFGQYDILLRSAENKEIILMKSGILKVEVE
ncbi:hypothetical protein ACLIKE_03910 [Ferroplasma acidiphilum]|uniref:Uncharacterized protein n=1 Tax=Ferroplasma acidiphilum TaxID=74969 RepID=A0A7K4FNA0_9ARCH|nr:hypothetical protein [Ferroplasma acidiphilum]NOL60291.1 hypothetical protein [Ferroplasma acidiphilum]